MTASTTVPNDRTEPKTILEAAQNGEAWAQNWVGVQYLFGEDVPKDPVNAAEWIRKAAEQRDRDAQANLGQLYEEVASGSPRLETTNATQPQISLKRWRGAEQQVLALLAARGWKVEDVSRQNIGYDIEAQQPDGENVCIEVKSLDYPGQPFTLTSNEEAVARQKGRAYRLALVRQTNSHIEIAFIADPISQLQLTRQCRQWVWECATYDFTPDRFALE